MIPSKGYVQGLQSCPVALIARTLEPQRNEPRTCPERRTGPKGLTQHSGSSNLCMEGDTALCLSEMIFRKPMGAAKPPSDVGDKTEGPSASLHGEVRPQESQTHESVLMLLLLMLYATYNLGDDAYYSHSHTYPAAATTPTYS